MATVRIVTTIATPIEVCFDIEAVCRAAGYEPPLICTPQELPPPEEQP